MMEELTAKEKVQLINLVKWAIGSSTQAEFAKKAGISAFNLSRILSSGNQKPQRSTLCKIAEASEGRVTERQLFIACGYEKQTDWKPNENDISSTCTELITDLVNGAKNITGKAMKYASIEDFLENLKLTRIMEWTSAEIFEEREYKGTGHKNAEMLTHVRLHYLFIEQKVYINVLMTFFFCKTVAGGYIFSDVAFDLETLMKTGHPWAEKVLFAQAAKGDLDVSDYPVVFDITSIKEAEKRLRKEIFGEGVENK